ncbi:MAG: radical SAM protein [Bacteroidales bacterium]|nr:radical SAM protein [Candidatus Physcousia equi]
MKINELFLSLQGEGHFTGTAALFLRFAGCNLSCPFCDTLHTPFTEYTEAQLIGAVLELSAGVRHIVITGGEPSLQLTDSFVDLLHQHGFFVQVETNGTHELPAKVDWSTCSPKANGTVVLTRINEIKLLFDGSEPTLHQGLQADEYRLQPLDTGNAERNNEITEKTINYILTHPQWKLSLQTHKILSIQ